MNSSCVDSPYLSPSSASANDNHPRLWRVEIVDWESRTSGILRQSDSSGAACGTLYVAEDESYVRWSYDELYSDTGKELRALAKKGRSTWCASKGWLVTKAAAQRMKDLASASGWVISTVGDLTSPQLVPVTTERCGTDAWILSTDIREWKRLVDEGKGNRIVRGLKRLASAMDYEWVIDPTQTDRIISTPRTGLEIDQLLKEFSSNGDYILPSGLVRCQGEPKNASRPIRVARGSLVRVEVDFRDPLHLVFIASQIRMKKGGLLGAEQLSLPLEAWKELSERYRRMGGDIEEIVSVSRFPVSLDPGIVPGWNSDAPNGKRLFSHQIEGIKFLVDHRMRGIVGDDMGLGKTAQSICASISVGAKRVLAIVPANAAMVWANEIQDWLGNGTEVVRIRSALDDIRLPESGWVIATYDLLTVRAESWTPEDAHEDEAFRDQLFKAFPDYKKKLTPKSLGAGSDVSSYPLDPRLLPGVGVWAQKAWLPETSRTEKLNRIGRRLSGEVLERLLAWDPDIVFVDEAHRIKNAEASRTEAVRKMLADETRGAVLMSGTPLRNHSGEGVALIDAVFPGLAQNLADHLSKGRWKEARKNARTEAVGRLLDAHMIRRKKSDVLDLPPKLRQYVPIELDGCSAEDYANVIKEARATLRAELMAGKTLPEARAVALPFLSRAIHDLGVAKVEGGEVSDLIDGIVEGKGCCIVFARHQSVSDELARQLRAKKISVRVIDGRSSVQDRATAATDFQNGELQVFIGGIHAAGEAITLTRADTCVFVELDWTPAAMFQAEDRGHRAGQKAQSYQIITIMGRAEDGGETLDDQIVEILQEKLADINATLGENESLIGERRERLSATTGAKSLWSGGAGSARWR